MCQRIGTKRVRDKATSKFI